MRSLRTLQNHVNPTALIIIIAASSLLIWLIRSRITGLNNICPGCNIVILSIDALRADHVGCYGYNKPTTPNIDSIAKEGILFENVFVQRGLSWVSIVSMFSSLYPITTGVRISGQNLDPGIPTIQSILEKEGYETAILKEEDRISTAIDWLKENRDKKVFLYFHHWGAHKAYTPREKHNLFTDKNYNGKYNGSTSVLDHITLNKITLSQSDLNHIIALYDGEIHCADSFIGEIYQALGELELLDKTIIVITADHGEDLYQHNYYFYHACSIYSSSLHVPLIIKIPGSRLVGRNSAIMESIDIVPTLLDLIGIQKPGTFQGKSILPLLSLFPLSKRKIKKDFEFAISEWRSEILTIRTNKWRYIYNPENVTPSWQPPGDFYKVSSEELYDIQADPKELKNVAGLFPEAAKTLREKLLSSYKPKYAVKAPAKASKEIIDALRKQGYITPE